MSERSNLRLLVLAVLVASLLGTLVIRTFYLQVMTGETYRAAAEDNTVREVVEPAVRGLVLDHEDRRNDARHQTPRGNTSTARVPAPATERMSRVPPICSAKDLTRNRPSPRPAPGAFVVKKGSPRRAAAVSSIPQP